jgi:hypothetical protein
MTAKLKWCRVRDLPNMPVMEDELLLCLFKLDIIDAEAYTSLYLIVEEEEQC